MAEGVNAAHVGHLLQTQPETIHSVPCKITGQVPEWLTGTLLRNGPGMYEVGPDKYKHLFDGLALMHSWTIRNGNVEFTSKYLRSNTYERNTKAQRIVVSEFGTLPVLDPCKTIFDRYFSYYFPGPDEMTDNALVNFLQCGDQIYAVTETPKMCRINPKDLSTLANAIDLRNVISVNTTTAHPHYLKDGTVINMALGSGTYHLVEIKTPEFECDLDHNAVNDAKTLCEIKYSTVYPSYYHSFGMTEQNLTKVHLRSLKTGTVTSSIQYTTDPFFTFHHVNAYETQDCVVCDVCAYDNGDVIQSLTLEELRAGKLPDKGSQANLRRFVLPLKVPEGLQPGDDVLSAIGFKSANARAVLQYDGSVHCTLFTVCDIAFEFPRINYDYNGLPYKYCYGASEVFGDPDKSGICKINVDTGECELWVKDSEQQFCGEPVFVPRPGGLHEDDGILLAPVMSVAPDQAPFLLLLDAKNMQEVARASQQCAIPFAFHAHFIEFHQTDFIPLLILSLFGSFCFLKRDYTALHFFDIMPRFNCALNPPCVDCGYALLSRCIFG